MIVMNNGELVAANRALNELAEERLPVAGALRVRRLLREVQAHLDDVEAVRKELLRRHGEVGEDGQLALDASGNATFEGDALVAFLSEYEELMAQTAEYERGLTVADLGQIEVKPAVLVGLGALLEEVA